MDKDAFDTLVLDSDRAVILISATILDNALKKLLDCCFCQERRTKRVRSSDVFENNAPLSSFSSKIKVAYLIGLVDQSIYEDLETIRKVRNAAAHEPGHMSLTQKKMKLLVEGLFCTQRFQSGSKTSTNEKEDYDFIEERKKELFAEQEGFVKYHKSIYVLGVLTIVQYIEHVCVIISRLNEQIKDNEPNLVGAILKTSKVASAYFNAAKDSK